MSKEHKHSQNLVYENACEECVEKMRADDIIDGTGRGLTQASRWLLTKAGEAFAEGKNDDKARLLRDLAGEIAKMAKDSDKEKG